MCCCKCSEKKPVIVNNFHIEVKNAEDFKRTVNQLKFGFMEAKMSTFEDFLIDCIEKNVEVRLVPSVNLVTNRIEFYAHPLGADGDTFDGEVSGKHVRKLDKSQPGLR